MLSLLFSAFCNCYKIRLRKLADAREKRRVGQNNKASNRLK
jgi:hypothetical protein